MINIEDVLNNIDPKSIYTLKVDKEWEEFNGVGLDEWKSSIDRPSYQDCINVKMEMMNDGVYEDFAVSVEKFINLTGTSAFTKIIDSADDKPEILLYAIVALVGVLLSLYKPRRSTIGLAKKAWNRFTTTSRSNREATQINEEDLSEFNKVVESSSLPQWLKL